MRVYGASCCFRLALLRKCGDDVAYYLVSAVESPFYTPHIDVARARHWFGEVKRFPQISCLLQVLSLAAPVDVAPGGDLLAEIAYSNHSSSGSHTGAIRAKIAQDIVNGSVLAFRRSSISDTRGLRVSPLGTVEGRKLCIIHDLTFAGDGYRSSVNDDTDFSAAPPCELGHVFADICKRILYLRQRHGVVSRVTLCHIHVKDLFRQIPVDPLHAGKSGYVFDEYAVVDLFLQLGWRSSPGFWNLGVSSLEHAHNQTSFKDVIVSEQGRSAVVAHVRVDADAGWETMPIPPDFEHVPSAGVVAGSRDAGRETMSIPPDCEHVPGSSITAGVADAGWETVSIPPDCTHIPGAGVAAGAPGPDRETMPIPSNCEHGPGNGGDTGDPFFVGLRRRWYFGRGAFLSRRAQASTCHRVARVVSFSISRPPRSTESPLLEAHN